MKIIKTTSYKTLSLIFITLSTSLNTLTAPSLIGCTIQFSKSSTLVPININCGGTQITTTIHETATPKITFEIPKASDQTHFEVLVTSAKINVKLKQFPNKMEILNTIDYLLINPESSYKYYVIDLIDNTWNIKEETLPETGQIPDKAIIIECYPEWVSNFKGGSGVELPTLHINNVAAEGSESEANFEEALIKLELTALDSKIIHAPIKRQIQTVADKKRLLIMDTLA